MKDLKAMRSGVCTDEIDQPSWAAKQEHCVCRDYKLVLTRAVKALVLLWAV